MNDKKILYSLTSTDFNVIEYLDNNGLKLRALASPNAIYSDTMTGDNKYDLYYPYIRLYDMPNIMMLDIKNTLVLGAGCCTYPKYYISKYQDKYMDCIEINKEIIDVAHKFFYLDDLYKEFDPNNERLKIFVEDGYEYINNCNKKYDYIFLDIFDNNEPDEAFLNSEFVNKITGCLNKNGIYSTNYIINSGKEEKFYNYISVLRKFFDSIFLLSTDEENVFNGTTGNVYIMCSNRDLLIPARDNIKLLNSVLLKG